MTNPDIWIISFTITQCLNKKEMKSNSIMEFSRVLFLSVYVILEKK